MSKLEGLINCSTMISNKKPDKQDKSLASINCSTANTIRIVSMRDADGKTHIPFANLRVGRSGRCVDNFCAGRITAAIDENTCIVSTNAFDKDGYEYVEHPDSRVQFVGFQVPYWEKVINLINTVCSIVPNARTVGWDVSIKDDGKICLIEGNHTPGAYVHQMSAKKGLRSIYKKHLGDF